MSETEINEEVSREELVKEVILANRRLTDCRYQIQELMQQAERAGKPDSADAARLDWLSLNCGYFAWQPSEGYLGYQESPFPWRLESRDELIDEWGESVREVIDQAIKKQRDGNP